MPPGTPPGATYICSLDGAPAVACTSPWDVTGLAMHQEAQVMVGARLPGVPLSNGVTRGVRRGLNPRGFGGGAAVGLAQLPDEGWVAWGGNVGVNLEASARNYARLLADGAFDPAQTGLTTGAEGPYLGEVIPVVQEMDAAGLPTGKTFVGGQFDRFNGAAVPRNLVRLTATGAVDPTWSGPDVGWEYDYVGVVVQELGMDGLPNGKLLVGGKFTRVDDNTDHQGLVRILPDGTVDPTWHAAGGFNDWVNTVWQVRGANNLPTGKLLVGGVFDAFDDQPVPKGLVMLLEDGSLDSSFGVGDGFDGWVATVLQPRDALGNHLPRYVVGGTFTQLDGVDIPARLVGLLSNGALDPSFNTGGEGLDGNSSNGAFGIIEEETPAGLPTGRLWVGGNFYDYYNGQSTDGELIRLNANGTRDMTVSPQVWGEISSLVPQRNANGTPTGKFWVAGDLDWVNDLPWTGLALLDANGTVDMSLPPQPMGGRAVYAVAQARDTSGGWLPGVHIAGSFRGWGGTPTGRGFTRLQANGAPHAVFTSNQGTGLYGEVRQVLPERDATGVLTGKLLVLGTFYDGYGVDVTDGILRLNDNGTRDTIYNAAAQGLYGAEGNTATPERTLAGGYTGKLWVGHGAREYNGTPIPGGLFRLQANGYRDATYNPVGFGYTNNGGYPASVDLIRQERDTSTGALTGKMLVAGSFDSFNGTPTPFGLVRLNNDGTLDATFNAGGSGLDGYYRNVLDLDQEVDANGVPNGRWVVGANLETYNGVTVRGAFRINADGTLDSTFNPEMYSEQRVDSVVQEYDVGAARFTTRWFLAGRFGTLANGAINIPDNLIRVEANGAWDPTYNTDLPGFDDDVYEMAPEFHFGQPTGNLILVGAFRHYNGETRLGLVRVLQDGAPDEYFHGQGRGP
jgi:uncharacterized delta-60 repeat protein